MLYIINMFTFQRQLSLTCFILYREVYLLFPFWIFMPNFIITVDNLNKKWPIRMLSWNHNDGCYKLLEKKNIFMKLKQNTLAFTQVYLE